MKKKNDRLSVKKKRYYRITAVIIISFALFELVSNFTYILYGRAKQESLSQLDNVDYNVIINALNETITEEYFLGDSIKDSEVILVGDSNVDTVKYISKELEYLKKYYSVIDDVTKIDLSFNPEIVILNKKNYTIEEQEIINGLSEKGIDLIFTSLPTQNLVESEWGKKIFAINKFNGEKIFKGIRIVSDFFIGDLVELYDLEVSFTDVDLAQGCKVYAYSLMDYYSEENIDSVPDFKLGDNEEMPPLIWRHILGESEIFVVNGDFMDSSVSCGIINSIISETKEVYLYPIINANSVFVLGLPYTENVNEEKMQSLYSRDALGVQQDLIFPGVFNIVSKYNLFPAYYSENYYEIKENTTDKQLAYYMKEFTKQTATLGYINEDGECLTLLRNGEVESMLSSLNSDFEFYDKDNFLLYLPIIQEDVHTTDKAILRNSASVSSLGYLSESVDVRDILNPKSEDDEWVKFEKDFASMESYQQEKFGYLENLNTEDTIKRIIIFEMLEPKIQYKTGEIFVKSENFFGEANFILRIENEIQEIVGGEFIKIGDKAYLISQKQDEMTIKYQEEIK